MIFDKKKLFFCVLKLFIILISCNSSVNSQDTSSFICELKNDTLTLGNSFFYRKYLWNKGHLKTIAYGNEILTFNFPAENDLSVPDDWINSEGTLSRQYIPGNEFQMSHLKISISTDFKSFNIIRHFKIYPHLPVLWQQLEIKGNGWQSALSSQNSNGKAMIESNQVLLNEEAHFDRFPLSNQHASVHAIQFKDATDHHDNLVFSNEFLPFRKTENIPGNIVLIEDKTNMQWFAILKESLLNECQLNYPGYDFSLNLKAIKLHGHGATEDDSIKSVFSYPVISAYFLKNETEATQVLKQYQLASFRYVPQRDHTFTINTWGDRSRDSRMNETFILSEIKNAARLGVTHLQLDDGWQKGLSINTAQKGGSKWTDWTSDDWTPHPERFPGGLDPIFKEAKKYDIQIGLWYNPGRKAKYSNWQEIAHQLSKFKTDWPVNPIKIDGIQIVDSDALIHIQNAFEELRSDHPDIILNMDVTADCRGGYFQLNRFGSIFLENRYTDWANYYPYKTHRNLWQLSKYIPAQRLQIEFLNKWRNADKYPAADSLAPIHVPFDYIFATTMVSQPLAWMEAGNLPEEAFSVSPLINIWKAHRDQISSGIVTPIGEEPNGYRHSGFISETEDYIYFLLFRELAEESIYTFKLAKSITSKNEIKLLYPTGTDIDISLNSSELRAVFPSKWSFVFAFLDK